MSFKRSKWKGVLLKNYLYKKIKKNSNSSIKIFNRNCIITPICIGNTFEIYSGKNFTKLIITEEMLGHKFGEFSITRKKNLFKK
nr:ribosomal protein S19 [Guinardia striata]